MASEGATDTPAGPLRSMGAAVADLPSPIGERRRRVPGGAADPGSSPRWARVAIPAPEFAASDARPRKAAEIGRPRRTVKTSRHRA